MRAFIVRPFGLKKDIDFDRVERELIAPALALAGVEGGSTQEVIAQGNIREDMFSRLLTADLVVADVSIHNANVFYELGVRHALRDRKTIVIRARIDDYPFDLQTDRYLEYDPARPGASVAALAKALDATKAANQPDSPVFKLLPGLLAQDPAVFLLVPHEFQEAVERARANNQLGDLSLLAAETHGLEWETAGLRLVARAQFEKREYDGARISWEEIRSRDSFDLEANLTLGTIYQRLGDLTESDIALTRALEVNARRKSDRAEAFALCARNAKARWLKDWRGLAPDKWRQQALKSPFLAQAYKEYESAFQEDLNHYYSGLNALGLLTVMVTLAAAFPDVWEALCGDDDDVDKKLDQYSRRQARLAGAVELSIKAAKRRQEREQTSDVWLDIGAADLAVLGQPRPARVAAAYCAALAHATDFNAASIRDQLQIYVDLDVCVENAQAALAELPAGTGAATPEPSKRRLLFTGHRVDDTGRAKPRFPKDQEAVARDAIKRAIQDELAGGAQIAFGIAGGASGGDILFHEVCEELGIPTHLYLALPREAFIAQSVASAGPGWVERFNRLYDKLPVRVLQQSESLPGWLQAKPDYGLWPRDNLWMLHNALVGAATRMTLIALWDGGTGDGPGGTADLVEQAGKRGAKSVVLDTRALFGLP